MNSEEFLVNGSKEMTERVKKIIDETDWLAIEDKNQAVVASTPLQRVGSITHMSPEQYATLMNTVIQYKDITTLLPKDTRFRFIKRVILRLIKVSTAYQQEYNNAAYQVLLGIIADLGQQQTVCEIIDEYFSAQEKKDHETSSRIEELTQKVEELSQKVEELSQKVEELSQKVEEFSNTIFHTAERQSQIQENFDRMKDAGLDFVSETSEPFRYIQSNSQAGEDGILAYVLNILQIRIDQCDYIDLGANHACFLSNTNYFYRHGARGVLVEANPHLIDELKFYRHGDIILNKMVSAKTGGKTKFYIMNGDGLSTFDYQAVQGFIKENPGLKVVDTVTVESITLTDIIENYLGHSPTILNIDVEGMEMDILKSMDFAKYRPLLIIIEMIPYKTSLIVGEKNQEILDYMNKAGYAEYAFTGINSIFIDQSKVEELSK